MEKLRLTRFPRFLVIGSLSVLLCLTILFLPIRTTKTDHSHWQVRSIDTMKYSRDMARSASSDPSFPKLIDLQMAAIAKTNANFVAIDTPYDDEFLPVLKQWVASARKYHLHVWFRGNFSGWEGWFGYQKITPEDHMQKTRQFILKNPDLFADGDIFTPCPECENGAMGDPRSTGQVDTFRSFLILESHISSEAFSQIGKKVATNYASMNADVARLIMTKDMARAMGNVIVIDHYAKEPQDYQTVISQLHQTTGAEIMIGEFGAPIPDIHGAMTQEEQKNWLVKTGAVLQQLPEVIGTNYWVNMGGSTALWDDTNNPKPAQKALAKLYY